MRKCLVSLFPRPNVQRPLFGFRTFLLRHFNWATVASVVSQLSIACVGHRIHCDLMHCELARGFRVLRLYVQSASGIQQSATDSVCAQFRNHAWRLGVGGLEPENRYPGLLWYRRRCGRASDPQEERTARETHRANPGNIFHQFTFNKSLQIETRAHMHRPQKSIPLAVKLTRSDIFRLTPATLKSQHIALPSRFACVEVDHV